MEATEDTVFAERSLHMPMFAEKDNVKQRSKWLAIRDWHIIKDP